MGDGIRSATLCIGQLEFDPHARLVIVPAQETLLDPRSSTVLLMLMEQFGQRIDKDELLRRAWPRQVVHENSLAKAISRLRRAIHGSGLEIAVSYGSGYTLRHVPARSTARSLSRAAVGPRTQPGAKWPLKSRWTSAAAVLGLVLLVAAGIYALARSDRASGVGDAPLVTNDAPDAVATILWVDDHPSNNLSEVAFLRSRHVAVHLAASTDDAISLLEMNSYQLVISDLGRGEDRLAGLRLVRSMKQRGIAVPVLIYTMRPKTRSGQKAQADLVAAAGASGLAVTPQEVRAKVLDKLRRQG